MSSNMGSVPMSANQIANSKASAGIFINMSLVIYTLGFLFKWAKNIEAIKDEITPQIMSIYRGVMFLGALFLLIGLSRTIGAQYDLTRFFILAIVFALNIFFDDVYQRVMNPEKGKKGKKGKKNKKD